MYHRVLSIPQASQDDFDMEKEMADVSKRLRERVGISITAASSIFSVCRHDLYVLALFIMLPKLYL